MGDKHEWLVYFTVPFWICLVYRSQRMGRWLLCIAAFCGLIWVEYAYGDLGLYHCGWQMLVRCVSECVVGIVLFYTTPIQHAVKWVTPVGAAACAYMAFPLPDVIAAGLLAGLVYVAASITSAEQHWLGRRELVYLGTISYSIYMLHWPVQQVVLELYQWKTGRTLPEVLLWPGKLVVISGLMLTVILLSHYCYQYVEAPCRRRLRRYFGTMHPPPGRPILAARPSQRTFATTCDVGEDPD